MDDFIAKCYNLAGIIILIVFIFIVIFLKLGYLLTKKGMIFWSSQPF